MKRAFDVLVAQSEDLPVLPAAATNEQVLQKFQHTLIKKRSKFLFLIIIIF
jgi:hypothetical protein